MISDRKEPNMATISLRWFALLLVALLFVPAFAADADDKEIARLVKQLGDDDFDKREAAALRLKEIGEPALDALVKAKSNSDPEVRRRADETVAVIEDKLYMEQLCLEGHTGNVWSVSVSADGKRVLTGSEDKTLRLGTPILANVCASSRATATGSSARCCRRMVSASYRAATTIRRCGCGTRQLAGNSSKWCIPVGSSVLHSVRRTRRFPGAWVTRCVCGI
jgi:hypothetical protein